MKRNALISVIVPVYKVEKYLKQCIDSILCQTYDNIQLILIDDGSPDLCPVICDQYAIFDNRVIVCHKENGGVSSARNAGLDLMNGDYLCFVDSDDQLPKDAILRLYEAISCKESSLVVGICGFMNDKRTKNKISNFYKFNIYEEPEKLLSYITQDGSYSPYAKLYDANVIRENRLRFREDMRIAEDTVFLRTYLGFCRSVCFVPFVVYHYNVDNENSLSKKMYNDYCWFYGEKLKAVSQLVERLPLTPKRRSLFLSQRGVNGIKLSVNHYFSHCKSKDARISFLEKTRNQLLPWVNEEYDVYNEGCDRWWKKYGKMFRNRQYIKLYRIIKIENRVLEIRALLGRIARSMFIKIR